MTNTGKLLIGVFALLTIVQKDLKDGFQVQDVIDLITKMNEDEGLKAKLNEAWAAKAEVAAEFSAFTFAKGIELVAVAYPLIKDFMSSFNEQQASQPVDAQAAPKQIV